MTPQNPILIGNSLLNHRLRIILARNTRIPANPLDGKRLCVLSQIACNAVGAGRQEATPLLLEMTDGGLIAAPRVIAGRSLQIPVDIRH